MSGNMKEMLLSVSPPSTLSSSSQITNPLENPSRKFISQHIYIHSSVCTSHMCTIVHLLLSVFLSTRPELCSEQFERGKFLLIYICNFHVLSHLLLIYICQLHWNYIGPLGPLPSRERYATQAVGVRLYCRHGIRLAYCR